MILISGFRWIWVNLWLFAEWLLWGVFLDRSGLYFIIFCIGWISRRIFIRSFTEMLRLRRYFYMLKFFVYLNIYKIFLKNEIIFICIVNFFFNFENYFRYIFLYFKKILKRWNDIVCWLFYLMKFIFFWIFNF